VIKACKKIEIDHKIRDDIDVFHFRHFSATSMEVQTPVTQLSEKEMDEMVAIYDVDTFMFDEGMIGEIEGIDDPNISIIDVNYCIENEVVD